MVQRMLFVAVGVYPEDDRDHFGNKRICTAGELMTSLFCQLFRRSINDVKKYCQKCLDDNKEILLPSAVKPATITRGIKYSLATGNWGQQGTPGVRAGVSQVLARLTYAATLSHLRRINAPIGREGKLTKPRKLHNTHWGIVCPAETPEGQACGLVKNLALMASVTNGGSFPQIAQFLQESVNHGTTKVFFNGTFMGTHGNPDALMDEMVSLRRSGDFPSDISLMHNRRLMEIRVCTDEGRCTRPLLVVKNGKILLPPEETSAPFDSLVANGYIEYIDTEEEETTMIAMFPDDVQRYHTHCEIHPSMILGVCASIVPFPDHNQSPRNTYQAAMGKQAMGIYCSNFNTRFDTQAYLLWYPQKPLVSTRSMHHFNFSELPAGTNSVVAIGCYTGYNQEDSLIMNQSSIDRGLFRSTYYHTIKDEEQNGEQFGMPDRNDTVNMQQGSYQKLDEDGIICAGSMVYVH